MKLWLLKRLASFPAYDCYDGMVIRAETESAARLIASAYPGDEGAVTWASSDLSSCHEILEDGAAGIILSDFNAG